MKVIKEIKKDLKGFGKKFKRTARKIIDNIDDFTYGVYINNKRKFTKNDKHNKHNERIIWIIDSNKTDRR